MIEDEPAKEAARITASDRGEAVTRMEPLLVSVQATEYSALMDRVMDLTGRSQAFRHSLPAEVVAALAQLVRAMNCYYSNLIAGHNIHPIEIEQALKQDPSADPDKRDWQQEATAHMAVQQWIDEGGLKGRAATVEGIRHIHRRFCEELPASMRWVEQPNSDGELIEVVPGEWRQHDVQVGRHVPISPGAVPRFLAHFEKACSTLGPSETVLAAASGHHRVLWVHPFMDANGRVARLMSYAMLLETLDTGGIWSIARGLARDVDEYKWQLAACDAPRLGDLDGRGNLSQAALVNFVTFFLDTCIDQVQYMQRLAEPNRLRRRMLQWASQAIEAKTLPAKSARILDALLYRGEIPRGEVAMITDTSERQARRIISALLKEEVVSAESLRAPIRLAFPARLASEWMPGLFPPMPEQG